MEAISNSEKWKRANEFRAIGFVHITGLCATGNDGEYVDTIRPLTEELGTRCHNQRNTVTIFVTLDGEIWMGDGALFRKAPGNYLSPNDRLIKICDPEKIAPHLLMKRMAHPYAVALCGARRRRKFRLRLD